MPFLVYQDIGWTVETSNEPVDAEVEALPTAAVSQRVVIVRVLTKKTEKTPRREIDLALARAKSIY